MEGEKVQKVLPVNSKVKDTFFKTVYHSEERLKGLAGFLLGIQTKDVTEPDLEAVVHIYDFRMTLAEILDYIETDSLPERLHDYTGDLLDYALVADSLTYIQRVGKNKKYVSPTNVSGAEELLELLKSRGIFVDLLSDREVCDMTMATFSREEIREYQGWERGMEEGRKEGRVEGREEGREEGLLKQLVMQVIKKLHKNKPIETIADELEEEPDVIRRICLAAEDCAPEYDVDEIYARLTSL